MLPAARATMMLFVVEGANVVARREGIEVTNGFDVGVGKGVEGVIRGSREWTH
jgi:hypothetical protein